MPTFIVKGYALVPIEVQMRVTATTNVEELSSKDGVRPGSPFTHHHV